MQFLFYIILPHYLFFGVEDDPAFSFCCYTRDHFVIIS